MEGYEFIKKLLKCYQGYQGYHMRVDIMCNNIHTGDTRVIRVIRVVIRMNIRAIRVIRVTFVSERIQSPALVRHTAIYTYRVIRVIRVIRDIRVVIKHENLFRVIRVIRYT